MRSHIAALIVVVSTLVAVTHGAAAERTTTRQYPVDGGSSITVKEYQFPGAIQSYWWVSDQDLVVMSKGHLFLSRNYASTGEWVSLTEALPEFAVNNSRVYGMGSVTGISFFSSNKSKPQDLLIVECLGPSTLILSITSDPMVVGRVSLENIPQTMGLLSRKNDMMVGMSVVFSDIQFHPTIEGAALAILRDPGCMLMDPFRCRSYLYYTSQSVSPMPFVSWRLVQTEMDVFQVVFGAFPSSSFDPNTAYFLSKPSMTATFLDGKLYAFDFKSVEVSLISRPTFTEILTSTFGEQSSGGFSVVAAADSDHRIRLFVSSDNFKTTPTAANFGTHIFPSDIHPFEEDLDEQETGYSLVDVQDELFVNVYRGSFDAKQQWGHTYRSGVHGRHFSLSLPYNRRLERRNGAVDFHRVGGLKGVILANVVLNPQDVSCRSCSTAAECDQFCEFGTVLSRDNGKSWQRIPAASEDCEGTEKECSLNLHSYASATTFNTHPVVSSESAPGLILATGNEGPFLDLRSENVVNADVFMSRDAGETWVKLSTGRGIYGETDFGGAIYLFPTGRTARHVNFSIDEGATWSYFPVQQEGKSYVFSDVLRSKMPNAHYINVLAFPGEGGNDVALWIDLSDLKDRTCVGMDTPNDPQSDFEFFQPSSYFDEKMGFKCFMGHMSSYTRKKFGASCWVSTTTLDSSSTLARFALPQHVQSCNCTREDYECDVDFVEVGESCVPEAQVVRGYPADEGANVAADVESSSAHADIPVVHTAENTLCESSERVSVKTGYRKLGGDTCTGGIDLDPTRVPCPSSTADHAVGFIALVVLAAAGAMLLISQKARTNPAFGALIIGVCPPLKYFIASDADADIINRYTIADGSEDDEEDEVGEDRHLTASHRADANLGRRRQAPLSEEPVGEEFGSPYKSTTDGGIDANTFAVPVTVSASPARETTNSTQQPEAYTGPSAESTAQLVELSAMEPPPLPPQGGAASPSQSAKGLDFIDFGQ